MLFADFTWVLVGRIVLAGMLGALLGFEEDKRLRTTKIRATMILGVAACLFTMISLQGFTDAATASYDRASVASQVVVAGGIIAAGFLLRGSTLTDAAQLWLAAAVGTAIGAGMELLAAFVTVIITIALTFIKDDEHATAVATAVARQKTLTKKG